LPTEAEWEYACRGGATSEEECSYQFYFDKPTNDLSYEQANFNVDQGRTTRVGAYPPNKLGLCDMHGNVFQWCADLWDLKQGGASDRVIRGGCWIHDASFCRAAFRVGFSPTFQLSRLGFRLARVPRPASGSASQSERSRSP
jgi:formylglycine-generating enzyme required for sulfatase activity